MKSSRGENLRAIRVEPGTEADDAPPEQAPDHTGQAIGTNAAVDDLDNLPETPHAIPIQPGGSNVVKPDDSDLDSIPDAGGKLGHVYDRVYHGDPDNVAKVLDTSKKLNADPAAVAGSLKDAQRLAQAPSGNFFQSIEDKYPGTTQFLQVPQHMAVVHDDLPNVTQHEDLVQKFHDAAAFEQSALTGGALQEELAFLRHQQMNGETVPKTDWFRTGGMVANSMGAPTNNIADRAAWIQGQLDQINKNKPQPGDSWIKRGLYGATEFLPQMASGAMTGVKYGAIAGGAALVAGAVTGPGDIPITTGAATAGFTAGEAEYNYRLMSGMTYDNLLKVRDDNGQPLPENVVKIASQVTGAIGAGLGMVKVGAILEGIPGGKEFVSKLTSSIPKEVLESPQTRSAAIKAFTENYIKSVAHGTAAMTGIAAVNIAGERGAETVSGRPFSHEGEPGVGQQLASAAGDAALTFGVLGGMGPAAGLYSDMAQARKAKMAGDFYRAMGETAEASKLRQRMPEAHQEFIGNLTKDGPVENIFIPQEAFNSYFQGKNIDPETVAGELGINDSYREAAQTGGDVKVPLDVWASQVAGTEHYQGLSGDIKFNPEDLTSNQIEQHRADIAEQIKQTEAEAKTGPSATDSAERVYEERYRQLVDAGMTPYEARHSATLHESAFRTLGERTGQDPHELAKRFSLQVNRRESMQEAEGKSFNQGAIQFKHLSDLSDEDFRQIPKEHMQTDVAENLGIELDDEGYGRRTTGHDDVTYAFKEGKAVGHLAVDNEGSVKSIAVSGEHQREGIAQSLYENYFKEHGYLKSDEPIAMEPAAKKLWQKLQKKYPEEITKTKDGWIFEKNKGTSYNQGEGEGPRGRIAFKDNKAVIDLFKNADRSTFLHETGHFFLEVMNGLASDESAPDQIKNDMKAVREWLGVKEGEDFQTEQHEKFARGFEQYLRKGKAPSDVLRRTFAKFKQWLVGIYKSVRNLNVELSPEIKSVMDRMLATDEEISRAQETIGYSQASGMDVPDSVKPKLDDLAFQAREQAESELMKEQMSELSSERKGFLESERKRLTEEAEKQVSQQPVYQAIDYIKSQVGDRKNIESMAKKLIEGKLKGEDAVHFETAAELQGVFGNGKELALNIVNSKVTDHFNNAVGEIVEKGMAQHADLMNKMNIRERALQLVHNDRRTELLALERNILSDKIKQTDVRQEISKRNRIEARVQAHAAKEQAKALLDQKPIREAGNFRIYTTAERNAAIKAAGAVKRKEFEKATEYKRQQMLNHALASEALKNRTEAEGAVKVLQDASRRGPDLKDMPYAFNRQVDQLLEKFGIKTPEPEDTATLTQIAKDMQGKGETFDDIANATGMIMDKQSGQWRPEALRDFVTRVNENYVGLQLPESVLSGAGVSDYRDMKMGELREVKNAVKTVTQLGKKYDRFLNDFIQVDIKQAAQALKKSIEENVGTPYAEKRMLGSKYSSPLREKVANLANIPDGMISTMVNTLTLCTYLDGGEVNGPAREYIYRPLKQAEDRKFSRYAKMREELTGENGLFAKHYTQKELAGYKSERIQYGDRWLTKENILSMALNWGNEQNRDRIRAGFGSRDGSGKLTPLSDDAINGLFSHLGKKDWDFAQAAWDHLDSYWPEIAALEMKVHGVEPERVETAPFENEHGAYRGGYYPIAYDFEKSTEAFKSEQQKTELYKSFSAASAQTESGHAISRASFVARPVRLSMDVFFNHLENVIHDLEFRPAIIDVNKFMNMPDVKGPIQNAVGQGAFRGMESWLKSVASDQSEHLNWLDKAMTWTRFGTTISALGLTPKAFLLHMPSNIFNAMWETGVQNTVRMMTRSALDVAMGRGELKDFVFSRSERMKQRLTVRDRDIMDMSRAWQGTAAGVIPHYAFMSLHLADEAVSIPLWADTFKKNVAEFGESKAAEIADETVTKTLGSGSKVDQVGFQRGSGVKKLFTMFYSWMSVMFNRAWLDGKMAGLEYKQGNVGSAAAIMAKATFWAWALPAVHEALLGEAMHNGPTTDDERKKRIAGKIVEHPFAMIPFVRDIVPPIIQKTLGERGGDFKISPIEQSFQNIYSPAADGARLAFTHKAPDEKYAEEVARGMSQAFGYPQQINTWAFNFMDFVQGNGEASMKDFLSRRHKK